MSSLFDSQRDATGAAPTADELHTMTLAELRALARQRRDAGQLVDAGIDDPKGLHHWIACANKTRLIDAIVTGAASGPYSAPGEPRDFATPPEPDLTDPDEPRPTARPTIAAQPEPDRPTVSPDRAAQVLADLGSLLTTRAAIDPEQIHAIARTEALQTAAPLASRLDALEAATSNAPAPLFVAWRDDHAEPRNIGLTHYLFPLALRITETGIPLIIVGPTGNGKSTMAHQIADALELGFFPHSCYQSEQVYNLVGYNTASGTYSPGIFRQPYEHGGLMLMDEIDNGNASTQVVLNSGLSNGVMAFPDAVIPRHDRFRFVGTANTFGTGPTAEYVGRSRLDAATLDRCVILYTDYDLALEAGIVGTKPPKDWKPTITFTLSDSPTMTGPAWFERVNRIRNAAGKTSAKIIISPRATIYGARLLAAGIDPQTVENIAVWKGADPTTRAKVEAAI